MSKEISRSLAELRKIAREMEMYKHKHLTLPVEPIKNWAEKLKATIDLLEREINARLLEGIEDVDEDFGHSPEDLNVF